jgi:hypothetical protein
MKECEKHIEKNTTESHWKNAGEDALHYQMNVALSVCVNSSSCRIAPAYKRIAAAVRVEFFFSSLKQILAGASTS